MQTSRRRFIGSVSATALLTGSAAYAQKRYDNGATDTEIKIGHTGPYSGPASAYGVIGKAIEAYWKSVNDAGGINGRKVTFITLDDGYNPARCLEAVRRLVEQDKVLCCFNTLGMPSNTAIQKYMNARKVPQLFVASGSWKWGRPETFPWTMGYQLDYFTEGLLCARHILANIRDARVGVLMQNDDFGRDYVEGFKEGLGKYHAEAIVELATYQVTDPTLESQLIQLKGSGANVFFNVSAPRFAARAIRTAAEIDWRPVQYMTNVSASVASVLKPAGLENAQGIITAAYLKDSTDGKWTDDDEMKTWSAWMDKWMPGANKNDSNYVYAYSVSFLMHQTLKNCGNELTHANVMRQATSFSKLRVPLLLPGITVSTSATDFYPIQSVQFERFEGETWQLFGEIMSAESS